MSISGADTTAAQAQLDSFIEKWKTEHVNALILVGAAASSKQFVEKVKAEIPDMQLVADTTSVEDGGQYDVKAGIKPNPYDGIITAEGRIGLEHSKTKNYTYCKQIFEKQTGITIPLPNDRGEAPERPSATTSTATPRTRAPTSRCSRTSPTRSARTSTTRTGPTPSTTSVRSRVMNTDFASLHTGKYDADDTYGLVAFDPSIKPYGDWRHVTPTENVGNTG